MKKILLLRFENKIKIYYFMTDFVEIFEESHDLKLKKYIRIFSILFEKTLL